jgi:hypothetical protein
MSFIQLPDDSSKVIDGSQIQSDTSQLVFVPLCPTSDVTVLAVNPLKWFFEATIDDLCALGIDLGLIWNNEPICS